MAKKKIVIVGGVAGGATAAARMRRLDEQAEIVLLERGEYISYANCGLPYYIGGVIQDREELLLQTPEAMHARYRLDVRVENQAVSIDRQAKTIQVRDPNGQLYTEPYDVLVLSTGSSPLRPPIPGIQSERVMTLWTVPDTDHIHQQIQQQGMKHAVVVGGGFIGLEMAENLRQIGIQVELVEMADQVMAPLDYEMAQLVHRQLRAAGVKLHLEDGVSEFIETPQGIQVKLGSGKSLQTDFVLLSIGVSPNHELAKQAGLELGERGGVVVDQYLRTSDESIYALGDLIEVQDFVLGHPTMIPLAGPANKQGRIVANNILGQPEPYLGTQGSSVAKVFQQTVATTGLNEKGLRRQGLVKGKDYTSVTIVQNDHAGYYPGATSMTLKLVFSMDGKKLYGAQIVGMRGVDKRIDVLGTAIRLGAGVHDLARLELAYAPPYSSAKDPVNMLGFVAGNLLENKVDFAEWNQLEQPGGQDLVVLDVREDFERARFGFKDSVNIPLGSLREQLDRLPKDKTILVFCAVGMRAYLANRILRENGFKNVMVYPGGMGFYISTHSE